MVVQLSGLKATNSPAQLSVSPQGRLPSAKVQDIQVRRSVQSSPQARLQEAGNSQQSSSGARLPRVLDFQG